MSTFMSSTGVGQVRVLAASSCSEGLAMIQHGAGLRLCLGWQGLTCGLPPLSLASLNNQCQVHSNYKWTQLSKCTYLSAGFLLLHCGPLFSEVPPVFTLGHLAALFSLLHFQVLMSICPCGVCWLLTTSWRWPPHTCKSSYLCILGESSYVIVYVNLLKMNKAARRRECPMYRICGSLNAGKTKLCYLLVIVAKYLRRSTYKINDLFLVAVLEVSVYGQLVCCC